MVIGNSLCPELAGAVANRPRHVPCPVHGGKDGLRCFDDFDETGGMVCNTCGAFPNGYLVLAWIHNITTQEAARLVRNTTKTVNNGDRMNPIKPVGSSRIVDVTAHIEIQSVLKNSVPITDPSAEPARRYFCNRGLNIEHYPSCLRFHDALPYYPTGQTLYPALVAPIIKNKAIVGLHRTYLTPQGNKIPESPAKKIFPTVYKGATTGGAIQLFQANHSLAVAEGIETALAICQMLEGPVWAAVSAQGLAKMEIPESVQVVYVFADNDLSGTGEKAAKELGSRLYSQGKEVHIMIPDLPESSDAKTVDWLDCLAALNKHVD